MGRHAANIALDENEEAELNHWLRWRNTKFGLHLRASIVLDSARGLSGEEIAEKTQNVATDRLQMAPTFCAESTGLFVRYTSFWAAEKK